MLAVHIAPLFQQATTPAFLADFEGPKPAEGLSIIPCPPKNFDELSPAEQKKAKALRTQQSLYKLYEIQSARQENAAIFKAYSTPARSEARSSFSFRRSSMMASPSSEAN